MADLQEEANLENISSKQEFISLLPIDYSYFITSIEKANDDKDDYIVIFRIKGITTEEKAREWFAGFQESSKMTYRLDRTYPDSGRKNVWKADFRCHHNTRNKKTVGKGKNFECKSNLTIIVKRVLENTRSADPYIKEWPTIVIIKMFHNHPLDAAPALKFRSVSKDIEKKLVELYHDGHTPLTALKAHKVDLMLEHGDNYTAVQQDRRLCPDQAYCYRLYYKTIGGPIKSSDKSAGGGVNAKDSVKSKTKNKKSKTEVVPNILRRSRGKRKEKQNNVPLSEIVLLSVSQSTEVADQNVVVQKGDGSSMIVQSMPAAQMEELQAAVQALEHGASYADLQSLGLAFSQSPTVHPFQPLKDTSGSVKQEWALNDGNGVLNVSPALECTCGQDPVSSPDRNVPEPALPDTGDAKGHFDNETDHFPTPLSEPLGLHVPSSSENNAMDVTLSIPPGCVLNEAMDHSPQLQSSLEQSPIPGTPNNWQGISQLQSAPRFTQAAIAVPGQHYQDSPQQQYYPTQMHHFQPLHSQVQSQIPQHFSHIGVEQASSHLQHFPISPNLQTIVQTSHPVLKSILTETSNYTMQQNVSSPTAGQQVYSDTNHQGGFRQVPPPSASRPDSVVVPNHHMQQYPMDIVAEGVVSDVAGEAIVSDMQHPPFIITRAREQEQTLETWVDGFLSQLRDKFLLNDLYQTAFARLRKNVEQNARTDLALCSALSNFAKRPLKADKPNMNVIYNPDTCKTKAASSSGASSKQTSSGPRHNEGSTSFRYATPRMNRFHFRSRTRFPSKKQRNARVGKYVMERDKFGRWKRTYKRKLKTVQLHAYEAPGLREILDGFDTVESEQQREREKEGAEALLQMEARVVVKPGVSTLESVKDGGVQDIVSDNSPSEVIDASECEQVLMDDGQFNSFCPADTCSGDCSVAVLSNSVPKTTHGNHYKIVVLNTSEVPPHAGSSCDSPQKQTNTPGALNRSEVLPSAASVDKSAPDTDSSGKEEAAVLSSEITQIHSTH
ncbi:uncharacterized protein LOC135485977 [Lineus longissimus]|uniref:uncharacterized protein LOC135485977 n=1 Tax=Lineus longissimus TaxID=88925 RepID=UPI00315D4BEE